MKKHNEETETPDQYAKESDEPKKFEDHEIESAAHKLMGAEEVKANPHLHSKAVAHLKGKMKHMGKITSIEKLKDVANKKIKENSDKEEKGSY